MLRTTVVEQSPRCGACIQPRPTTAWSAGASQHQPWTKTVAVVLTVLLHAPSPLPHSKLRRRWFATLMALVRALEVVGGIAAEKHPWLRSKHADAVLMMLSSGQAMWAHTFYRNFHDPVRAYTSAACECCVREFKYFRYPRPPRPTPSSTRTRPSTPVTQRLLGGDASPRWYGSTGLQRQYPRP